MMVVQVMDDQMTKTLACQRREVQVFRLREDDCSQLVEVKVFRLREDDRSQLVGQF